MANSNRINTDDVTFTGPYKVNGKTALSDDVGITVGDIDSGAKTEYTTAAIVHYGDTQYFNSNDGLEAFAQLDTDDFIVNTANGIDSSGGFLVTGGTAKLDIFFQGSATLDFGSIAAHSSADLTIPVDSGVAVGIDATVTLGIPFSSVNATNVIFNAFISDVGEITVRCVNYTAGAINPPSGIFKVLVFKFSAI